MAATSGPTSHRAAVKKSKLRKRIRNLNRELEGLRTFAIETRRLIEPDWGRTPLRDAIPRMSNDLKPITYDLSGMTGTKGPDEPPDMGVVARVPEAGGGGGGNAGLTITFSNVSAKSAQQVMDDHNEQLLQTWRAG